MYIEKINGPDDVKKIEVSELPKLAEEMRHALLIRASKHGGHFGPNFGMVEATIALHYVFDSPKDKIVFDVSHQSYPHKMLTGRKDAYLYEEHYDDVSGYTNPHERAHDFLRNAMYDKNDERYKICSFHLHQACENYYNSIILTFTLYSPKEHSLITLSGRAKTHSLESSEAFPRDTEEEKRLFDLLQDAYVQARYNLHFRVTKEDIEALIPKVELLRDITRQCCEERIKVYAAKQRQV